MARSGLAAATAALLLVAGCAGGGSRPAGATTSTPSASGSTQTYLGLPVHVIRPSATIHDRAGAGFLLADTERGRIWVGSTTGLSWVDPVHDALHRVDSKRGVSLALLGDSLYRAAYQGGDVALYRLGGARPAERVRVRSPKPLIVSAGPYGIWVSDHWNGTLSRLDPVTLAVQCSLMVGSGEGLALGGQVWVGNRLWVVSQRDRRLYEIDPGRCRVLRHVDLGATPADDISLVGTQILVGVVTRAGGAISTLQVVDTVGARLGTRVVAGDGVPSDDLGNGGVEAPIVIDGQVWAPSGRYLVRLDRVHGWLPDRVVQIAAPAGFAARWSTVAFGSVWVSSMNPPVATVRLDQAALR